MIQFKLAHAMLARQSPFKLFKQNKPVTQYDDFLAFIKLFDDFTGQNCFASPCRRFDNKAAMRFQNIRKSVNDALLPAS